MPSNDNYDDMTIHVEMAMGLAVDKSVLELSTFIQNLRLAGATDETIQVLLMADIAEGGIVFGTFKNGLKNTMKDALGMAGNIAGMKVYKEAGVDKFIWVSVGSGACPDCLSREGRVASFDLFQQIGTPRSGWSVCRGHCKCRLVPAEYKGATNIKR